MRRSERDTDSEEENEWGEGRGQGKEEEEEEEEGSRGGLQTLMALPTLSQFRNRDRQEAGLGALQQRARNRQSPFTSLPPRSAARSHKVSSPKSQYL